MNASARTLALLDDGSAPWWRSGNRGEYDEEVAQGEQEKLQEAVQQLQEQANRAREERVVWSKNELDRYRPKTAFAWEQQSRGVCLGSCRSPRTTEDVRLQREADSRQETIELRRERRALRRQAALSAHRYSQLRDDVVQRRQRERQLVLERARLQGVKEDVGAMDALHMALSTRMVHGLVSQGAEAARQDHGGGSDSSHLLERNGRPARDRNTD